MSSCGSRLEGSVMEDVGSFVVSAAGGTKTMPLNKSSSLVVENESVMFVIADAFSAYNRDFNGPSVSVPYIDRVSLYFMESFLMAYKKHV